MANGGSQFETLLCSILSDAGFWAHQLARAKDGGQPFDVVAGRNGLIHGFECKDIQSQKSFRMDRIEDNQILGTEKFIKAGNQSCWFAFKRRDGSIWLEPASYVIGVLKERLENGEPEGTIMPGSIPLERWIYENKG